MTKKQNKASAGKDDSSGDRGSGMEWRGWMIRGAVLTVLIFVFVLWRLYPVVGNTAFLYAFGLGGAIMGWTLFSYYLLNR
jgi:hypothetical protein